MHAKTCGLAANGNPGQCRRPGDDAGLRIDHRSRGRPDERVGERVVFHDDDEITVFVVGIYPTWRNGEKTGHSFIAFGLHSIERRKKKNKTESMKPLQTKRIKHLFIICCFFICS